MKSYIKSVLELEDRVRVIAIILAAVLVLGLSIYHIAVDAVYAQQHGASAMQQHMKMN